MRFFQAYKRLMVQYCLVKKIAGEGPRDLSFI